MEKKFEKPFTKEQIENFKSVKDIMPPYDELDKNFKYGKTIWNEAVSDWFFSGVKKSQFVENTGIDKEAAFMHLRAIISSWEPKHEHKEAGAAYLMSLWFKKYIK